MLEQKPQLQPHGDNSANIVGKHEQLLNTVAAAAAAVSPRFGVGTPPKGDKGNL